MKKTNKDVAVSLLVFTMFAIIVGFGVSVFYLIQTPNASIANRGNDTVIEQHAYTNVK